MKTTLISIALTLFAALVATQTGQILLAIGLLMLLVLLTRIAIAQHVDDMTWEQAMETATPVFVIFLLLFGGGIALAWGNQILNHDALPARQMAFHY